MSVRVQYNSAIITKEYHGDGFDIVEKLELCPDDEGAGRFIEMKTDCFTIENTADLDVVVKAIKELLNQT